MKKRIQVLIFAAFMLLAAGCGSNNLSDAVDQAGAGSGSGTVGSAADTAVDSGSLNVENDTFTFEQLTLQPGSSEADVLKLLGADQKSDSYSTTLFGANVTIVLTSENDTVSSIKLTFDETDSQLVSNAISEQLAQDGESADNTTKWTYENSAVTLTQTDNGCIVEITGK